ncbi:hypothetical protein CRG98_034335 [Punica granatum]|uniref:Uncharacterized protein n=1 Tax=Punica granatum TaxID=22663 RepID=A0A2I0IMN0_PUNGR|nr:hypothetical protein CRG98_034335 [Punica granatum]
MRDELDVTMDEFDVAMDKFDVTRDELDVTKDDFDVIKDEFDITVFFRDPDDTICEGAIFLIVIVPAVNVRSAYPGQALGKNMNGY